MAGAVICFQLLVLAIGAVYISRSSVTQTKSLMDISDALQVGLGISTRGLCGSFASADLVASELGRWPDLQEPALLGHVLDGVGSCSADGAFGRLRDDRAVREVDGYRALIQSLWGPLHLCNASRPGGACSAQLCSPRKEHALAYVDAFRNMTGYSRMAGWASCEDGAIAAKHVRHEEPGNTAVASGGFDLSCRGPWGQSRASLGCAIKGGFGDVLEVVDGGGFSYLWQELRVQSGETYVVRGQFWKDPLSCDKNVHINAWCSPSLNICPGQRRDEWWKSECIVHLKPSGPGEAWESFSASFSATSSVVTLYLPQEWDKSAWLRDLTVKPKFDLSCSADWSKFNADFACSSQGGSDNVLEVKDLAGLRGSCIWQELEVTSGMTYTIKGEFWRNPLKCWDGTDPSVFWCSPSINICDGEYRPHWFQNPCLLKVRPTSSGDSWESFSVSFTAPSSKVTLYIPQQAEYTAWVRRLQLVQEISWDYWAIEWNQHFLLWLQNFSVMAQTPGRIWPCQLHGRGCESYQCFDKRRQASCWPSLHCQTDRTSSDQQTVSVVEASRLPWWQCVSNSFSWLALSEMMGTVLVVAVYMCIKKGCMWCFDASTMKDVSKIITEARPEEETRQLHENR